MDLRPEIKIALADDSHVIESNATQLVSSRTSFRDEPGFKSRRTTPGHIVLRLDARLPWDIAAISFGDSDITVVERCGVALSANADIDPAGRESLVSLLETEGVAYTSQIDLNNYDEAYREVHGDEYVAKMHAERERRAASKRNRSSHLQVDRK